MPKGPQRYNPHEEAARRRKAYDFASYLEQKGVSSSDLGSMHPTVLAKHAESAGLRSHPSPETLEMVHSHLSYKQRLKSDPTFQGDPFEGL